MWTYTNACICGQSSIIASLLLVAVVAVAAVLTYYAVTVFQERVSPSQAPEEFAQIGKVEGMAVCHPQA